jgi:asparagine synthase (glutamine-hydrolysing)
VDTSVDPVALHHYLSWHSVVPAPRTILNGVRKLAPATVMVVEPDGRRSERVYWNPPHERDRDRSEEEWRDALLDSLRVAVRRRMVSDVPVGVLLSGGLDSSLIVALLAEQGQHGLATFSIGFPDAGGREGNEFAFSDLVAAEFGTDHHQIRVGIRELVEALPQAIAAMSEPMISHDCVAFWLLAQAVSRERKVVQSGQGADEVLGGYSWYPPLLDAPGTGLDAYAAEFFDRDHDGVRELTAAAAGDDVSRAFAAGWFDRPGAASPVDRALRLDSRIMLVDDPVKRVDNMTMAHGLEARTPFLDHELVELAAACPPELKLAAGGKGILKAASRGIVPDAVIDREKGYFPVPALSHLEEPVLGMVREALLTPEARERGLFRPEVVEAMLADPNAHRTNLDGSSLWQIGLLELWLQEHVG